MSSVMGKLCTLFQRLLQIGKGVRDLLSHALPHDIADVIRLIVHSAGRFS